MSTCSKLLNCTECVRQVCRWILRYKINPICASVDGPLPDLAISEIDANGTCPGIPNIIPTSDLFGEVAKYYSIIGTIVVICVGAVLFWMYKRHIPWHRLVNQVEDALNEGRRMRDWTEEPLINEDGEAAGNFDGNVPQQAAGNVPGDDEEQAAERADEPRVEEVDLFAHGDDDDEEAVWASPQAEIINEARYPKRSTRGQKPDRYSPS